MSGRPDETVLFVHVPKSAGSTCNWLIRRHHRPGEQVVIRQYFHQFDLPVEQAQALFRGGPGPEVISCHMAFGLDEHLPRACTYVSFLRRPQARVLSAYRYVRRRENQPLYAPAHRMSLPELLDSGLFHEGDNGQVRRLSGVGASLAVGGCTEATLQQAMDNVERRFALVGLTERFDESILLMAEVMRWPRPFYWVQNQNKGRVTPTPTDEATLAAVAAHNELDERLYRWAEDRLDAEIAQRGPQFVRAVRTFQLLNRTYFPVRVLPERAMAKLRVEVEQRRSA